MNDGFVFYASFYEALIELPDDQRVQAYDAICKYGICGEEPNCAGIVKAVFRLVKPQIDANNKRREAGRKGGQAERKQTEATVKQNEANAKQNEANTEQPEAKVKVKDKVKVKEKVKNNNTALTRSGLSPDSELGREVQNFIDHRRRIRKPMTDHAIELFINRVLELAETDAERVRLIQTAIERGWQTVYPEKGEKKTVNKFDNFEPRAYDYDDLETQLLRASR